MMAENRWRLVKLVRDRVGRFNRAEGVEYRPILSDDQAREQLRAKLVEEATEYLLDPSVAELADVLEVVRGLGRIMHSASLADLVAHADAKRAERGGFDRLMGMYVLSDPSRSPHETRPTEPAQGGKDG